MQMPILIVDDNRIMRIVLKDILLRNSNIQEQLIFESASAEQAIKIVKLVSPVLIFVDIHLLGIDGITLVKQIRENECESYITIFSSSRKKSDIIESIKAGANNYLMKPPDIKRIIEILEKINLKITRPDKTNQSPRYIVGEEAKNKPKAKILVEDMIYLKNIGYKKK